MNYEEALFGKTKDGDDVRSITVSNHRGLSAKLISYGATLISVKMPDKHGTIGEITLGFDTLDGYLDRHPYFGSTVGRYANRISEAKFVLDGKEYSLYKNDGNNHLHGGLNGFDRRIWDIDVRSAQSEITVSFSRTSADGEEGYPGNVNVSVDFTLNEDNDLFFDYRGKSDKPTPLNLTNHTYWNLAGPGETVLEHMLNINARRYLSIDAELIPDGGVHDVSNTAFDFTAEKEIGRDIEQVNGYDHCFILDEGNGLRSAARLHDPVSGRSMEVFTTLPAIQLYTANMLEDTVGRSNVIYRRHGAVCLETAAYNNAVNMPDFPPVILRPGTEYRETTKHHFESVSG